MTILPGVYRERLRINKRVNLIGSGSSGPDRTEIVAPVPTEVVPAARAVGVVTIGPGGGGRIHSVLIRGGDAAILGKAGGRRLPAIVQISDVLMEQSARGILGVFSTLIVLDTKVRRTAWHGIAVSTSSLLAQRIDLSSAGGCGLLLFAGKGTEPVVIADSYFFGNAAAGIAIFGTGLGTAPIHLDGCNLFANTGAGLHLQALDTALVKNSQVSLTYHDDGGNSIGLVLQECRGVTKVTNSMLAWNDYGAANTGSIFHFGDNLFYANYFSIGASFASEWPTVFEDLGGNTAFLLTLDGAIVPSAVQIRPFDGNYSPPTAP